MLNPTKIWCHVVEPISGQPHGHFVKRHSWDECPLCQNDERTFSEESLISLQRYKEEMSRNGRFFRPALEDWSPCFPFGLVAIGISEEWPKEYCELKGISFEHQPRYVRILGADDTAMVKIAASYEEAKRVIKDLPCVIAMDDLLARGFQWD